MITSSVRNRARCSQYITKRGCSQKKKKNKPLNIAGIKCSQRFLGALTFSTTTGITVRNIHLQRAQGCFACSLLSFTSYIVPSSHVHLLSRMTKIHGDGMATEFVPRNFFSIWVLANDRHAQFRDKVKCQLLHDPTPSLSFSTPEQSGIFGRAEKRALESTKPPYLLASKSET